MNRERAAAVIGQGAVTPLASGVPATFAALVAGRSAIGPIRRFDASRYPVTFAAEITHDRTGPALYAALLDEALAEARAGLDLSSVAPHRIGVFLGSEAVRPDLEVLAHGLGSADPPSPADVAAHLPAAVTRRVARAVGAMGPQGTYSVACTSSGMALGEALLAIRRGEVDVAFAGGVDVLVHPLMVTGFARLGALSTRNDDPASASRPFDLDRDGFVLGEGSGMVVLASPRIADRLGPVHGWLSGYGLTCNAWRITDSPADGRGAAEAMANAVADAGRTPEDVAYINAHGTSTPQNDASEARAVRRAFGDQAGRMPISSTKSAMGHLVAACGVVEAIVALRAVCERVAPPTLNLDRVDPECALDHVGRFAREIRPGVALTNAFGFGGSNASLVLEAP
jgi:3-oxoacyl-[acyl-carrier-protein] synthase II